MQVISRTHSSCKYVCVNWAQLASIMGNGSSRLLASFGSLHLKTNINNEPNMRLDERLNRLAHKTMS